MNAYVWQLVCKRAGRKICCGEKKTKLLRWNAITFSLNQRTRNFSGNFSDTLYFFYLNIAFMSVSLHFYRIYCRHRNRFHFTSFRYDDNFVWLGVQKSAPILSVNATLTSILLFFMNMHIFLWQSNFSCSIKDVKNGKYMRRGQRVIIRNEYTRAYEFFFSLQKKSSVNSFLEVSFHSLYIFTTLSMKMSKSLPFSSVYRIL